MRKSALLYTAFLGILLICVLTLAGCRAQRFVLDRLFPGKEPAVSTPLETEMSDSIGDAYTATTSSDADSGFAISTKPSDESHPFYETDDFGESASYDESHYFVESDPFTDTEPFDESDSFDESERESEPEYHDTETESRHSHTIVTDPARDATCTQSGLTEGEHCSTCGEIISPQDSIAALGHRYNSRGICTVCGEALQPTEGLKYEAINNGRAYKVVGLGDVTATEIFIPGEYRGFPVTEIDNSAFSFESQLTCVVIPESITRIGLSAFASCSGLTGIYIHKYVTYIGDQAFAMCTSLREITVEPGNARYHSSGNCVIRTASKVLVFGCSTSVIPADGSVTIIQNSAFAHHNMSEITIPLSITEIGVLAFTDCDYLRTIRYTGTMEQWNDIRKGSSWDYGTPAYTVRCTDGTISKGS